MSDNATLAPIFIDCSLSKLNQFSSRLLDCIGRLSEEQVWLRFTEDQNAVGNLVLHLCGNVRQWLISGVGGQPDIRERNNEFAARGGLSKAELSNLLQKTLAEAVSTLQKITPERLAERKGIQGYDVTVLEAVYGVVEHFAQHTAQVIFITKLFVGDDLGYFKHLNTGAPERSGGATR